MPNEGDFVRIQMRVENLDETPEYLYGVVAELQSQDMFAKIELSEPYKGAKYTSVPRYMAIRIPKIVYDMKTKSHVNPNLECDHNWIFSGNSFNKDIPMYDCKICGKRKEDL